MEYCLHTLSKRQHTSANMILHQFAAINSNIQQQTAHATVHTPWQVIELAAQLRLARSLTSLTLAGCALGDKGVRFLVPALSADAAWGCSSLRALSLRGNEVGVAGARALGVVLTPSQMGASELAYILGSRDKYGRCNEDTLHRRECVAWTYHTSLVSLDLRDNSLGPKGTHLLLAAVKPTAAADSTVTVGSMYNTTITQLQLSGNQLRAKGGMAMLQLLRSSNHIQRLDIGSNMIATWDRGQDMLNDTTFRGVASALRFNQTLTSLDLSRNVGDEDRSTRTLVGKDEQRVCTL